MLTSLKYTWTLILKKEYLQRYFLKDEDGTYWDIQNNPQHKNNLPNKNPILQFQRKSFLDFFSLGVEVA